MERELRVVMIEDDRDFSAVLKSVLDQEREPRMRLETFESLGAALPRLRGALGIDAILLDLSLPDSEGLSTLDVVRDAAPEIPVVVLTVNDERAAGLDAVRKGAQAYVVKGAIDLKFVPRLLEHAIERKRAELLLSENRRLEELNRMLMDRERRVLELKQEVNALLARLGEAAKYNVEVPETY